MADGWERVASLPGLDAGEIQVWRIDLAESEESPAIYRSHLSREELERADRLRPGPARMQFVVARASLRVLLGNLLQVAPMEIPIALSAYGKPETPQANGRRIHFNVAHSRHTILIAICRESAVGIDLEYFDRETDVLEVARASFTEEECRQIEAADGLEQQRRAFFRCWTRKEAVVKADGRGLSLPLTRFEVPVMHDAQRTVARVAEAGGEMADWYLTDLALGDEIAAAFAATISAPRVRTFLFPIHAMPEAGAKT